MTLVLCGILLNTSPSYLLGFRQHYFLQIYTLINRQKCGFLCLFFSSFCFFFICMNGMSIENCSFRFFPSADLHITFNLSLILKLYNEILFGDGGGEAET